MKAGLAALFLCTVVSCLVHSGRSAAAPDTRCRTLAGKAIPGLAIRHTEMLAAGTMMPMEFAAPAKVADPVCRLSGTVSTRPGQSIGLEVWMPVHWNQRFEGVGSGGFGGSISYGELVAATAQGFAAASTDTGHQGAAFAKEGDKLPWAAHAVTLDDWGRNAVHLMTVAARRVVSAYYGKAPLHAYFNGCSTGGAEAMSEAEFFPADYDGIQAGSPGMAYSRLIQSFMWTATPSRRDPLAALPETALALLHDAVLHACTGAKAVPSDRFLAQPETCHFDPGTLACRPGQPAQECLSPRQVDAARHIYSPVVNARSGAEIYPGYARGGEADPAHSPGKFSVTGWYMNQDVLAGAVSAPLLGNTIMHDPAWNWMSFDFDEDSDKIARLLSPRIDAMNPDLRVFAARGGKLIMTQGWSDAFNAPTLPIEYWKNVAGFMGNPDRFMRLFMVPGMGHCGGGPGLNVFGGPGQPPAPAFDAEHDVVASLVRWVEENKAPDTLVATRYGPDSAHGRIEMQRPLCGYPRHAAYRGSGDTSRAESFMCQ